MPHTALAHTRAVRQHAEPRQCRLGGLKPSTALPATRHLLTRGAADARGAVVSRWPARPRKSLHTTIQGGANRSIQALHQVAGQDRKSKPPSTFAPHLVN